MNQIDERELVIHLKKSNVNAFDSLFYRYYKKVLSFCYKILGTKEDAEEIVQTVFLAIWENRTIIDEDKHFETYLFSIVRHHVYNALKRKSYRKAFLESIENPNIGSNLDVEDQVYYNDLNLLLNKLIDTLPPKRREIYLLSRNRGLTYKQIADKLRITENTVDTQIRNALNYLRPILEKFFK